MARIGALVTPFVAQVSDVFQDSPVREKQCSVLCWVEVKRDVGTQRSWLLWCCYCCAGDAEGVRVPGDLNLRNHERSGWRRVHVVANRNQGKRDDGNECIYFFSSNRRDV